MAENKTKATEPKKGGSGKGLLIAFIIILLAINGFQLFLNLSKDETIAQQTTTIDANKAKIDSLNIQLDITIKDLEAKKQQIAELGGDTARLGDQIRQLIVEKKQIQASAYNWQKKFKEIQNKIEEANQIRVQATDEVDRLKALLAKQDTIINDQKNVIVQREDSIVKINTDRTQLAEKVKLASVLRAESFTVKPINKKGKEEKKFKVKRVEKLKIAFVIGDNKVAEKGGRDLFIRVIEPDGAALFDLANGGGSVQVDGKELFYTYKQNILFNNNKPSVEFEYVKGSLFKVGVHKLEVYCEGAKIGDSTFEIVK